MFPCGGPALTRRRQQQEVGGPTLRGEERHPGAEPNMPSQALTPRASLIILLWPPHRVTVMVAVFKKEGLI